MPASLHPAFPHSHTHACSPFPGAPSSQGHTRGTGVLWSLAGSDTDQSEGGTRSPRQLVHRHKGGSPGIAQNRSVLPVIHLIITACLTLSIILCQPWKPGLAQAPQNQPKLPQPISPQTRTLPQHTSSTGLVPPSPVLRPTSSPTRQRSQRCPVTPALHRQRPLWGSQVSVPHGEQSHPAESGGYGYCPVPDSVLHAVFPIIWSWPLPPHIQSHWFLLALLLTAPP